MEAGDRIKRNCITVRCTVVFLSTLMLLTVSSCKTGQRVSARKPVMDATVTEVPLPISTPYDYFGDGRTAYLEAYREGYQSGMPAFFNPYARVGVSDPRSVGWHDGSFTARLAEAMRIMKE